MYSKAPLKPWDPVVEVNQPSGEIRYIRENFFGSGQESFPEPPVEDQAQFESLSNIMPVAQGTLKRRWGYSLFANPAVVSPRLFLFQKDAGLQRNIMVCSTDKIVALNEDGTTYNSQVTPNRFAVWGLASIWGTGGTGAGAGTPRMVDSRSYAYFVNGLSNELWKWDGSASGGLTNWGFAAPVTALSVGAPLAGGAITLAAGRKYYVVYRSSVSGHYSDLSPISASSGPLTAQNVLLSNIPSSSETQVNRKTVLATLDGGDPSTLYFLADMTNTTTSVVDNIPDATLALNNIYLETDEFGVEHGVADNTPPPNGTLPIKHRGRLFMALGQLLYFSKNLEEVTTSTGLIAGRYEEAWPGDFFTDVSYGAETIRGLISDGSVLYMGTEKHIRKLEGDSPSNFSQPEILFNEVGVVTQESWRPVFLEGQPVGVMWMTPDLRVIGSDFNAYQDIGTPIQDVLNTTNTAQLSKIHSLFVSSGTFDLYLLFIPTGANTDCDTICVYDLRSHKWVIWTPTDAFFASLFNISLSGIPQWLTSTAAGKLYQFIGTATQDRVGDTPVSFAATAKTTWLHLGSPTDRKLLNELEVMTGDTAMSVTVEGASDQQTFATPNLVKTATVTTGPFGQQKLFLAGSPSKDRYYRLTFTSPAGTTSKVLEGFSISAIPVNKL
jgi:hypothetical protein